MENKLRRREGEREKELWQLICQSRDGDEEAFEKLIRLRRERIYWLAYQMMEDEEDAREIAQLAFIRLWRSLKKFKELKSFDFWLRRVVINLCLDELRKRKKEREFISVVIDRAKETSLPKHAEDKDILVIKELQNIFNRLSAKLAPKQKAALILVDIEGFSAAEVSRIMGCRPSTVRNHVMLARRFLRQQLKRYYPEYLKGIKREGQDG